MTTIAFVGVAHIHTPGFVKRVKERPDVRVKTVWDVQPERAAKWAAELGARIAPDANSVWADGDVEAVVICSETAGHEALVLPAARAGKHMFVEKPLGVAAADAFTMARAIRKAGVLFQTGYFMRGSPVHQFLREQVQKGHFGKITRVRGSNCHAGSLKGWFDTDWRWMADPKIAGCGAFGDLGTHSLDILMWLFGDVEQVAAQIGVATGRYGDCDEYGEGLMRFAGGAVGTLAAGWVDVANPVTLLISGTQGHAHVCNGQLFFQSEHVPGSDGKAPWTELPAAWPHAFELWLDAVGGKADVPLVGAYEAAARSAVMEALYTAAAKGRWVKPKKAPGTRS